ncbi:CHAT domain-containing protein [Streptomyces phaeochromogenes]
MPPDGLFLEITRYEPADLRAMKGSAGPAHYGAFAIGTGRFAAATYYDLGQAEELDDLIALMREDTSSEPSLQGGYVTIRPSEARRLHGDAMTEPQDSHVTHVRSGQRIERAGELNAEAFRSFMCRIENGEPLLHSEIRQLITDGSDRGPTTERPAAARAPESADAPPPARDLAVETADQLPDTDSTGAAKLIGHRLLQPLARRLKHAKHLAIAPDSNFWLIPFSVLSDGNRAPLVTQVDITLVNPEVSDPGDGDTMVPRSAPARPPGAPLVIAAPAYSSSAVPTTVTFLAPLPGARKEGLAVAALLGTTCHSQADATDTLLRTTAAPAVLHLATHGFAVPDRRAGGLRNAKEIPDDVHGLELLGNMDNPEYRTGLTFARAEDWFDQGNGLPGPGDGLLLAVDIANLDLEGTELVVLSACHTGMGQVETDDTPWSLARSFRQAGAGAVVMSLWTVPDDSTRILMEAFYTRLLDAVTPARALRDAQLLLISSGASPRQWAAFTCWGSSTSTPLVSMVARS